MKAESEEKEGGLIERDIQNQHNYYWFIAVPVSAV
jgi:hypothetical protein